MIHSANYMVVTIDDIQEPEPPTSPLSGIEYISGIEPVQLSFGQLNVSVAFTNTNGTVNVKPFDYNVFLIQSYRPPWLHANPYCLF